MNKKYLAKGTKKVLVYIITLTLCFPVLSLNVIADSEDPVPPYVSGNGVVEGSGATADNADKNSEGEAKTDPVSGSDENDSGKDVSSADDRDSSSDTSSSESSGSSAGAAYDPASDESGQTTDGAVKTPDTTTDGGIKSPDTTTDSGIEPPVATTDGGIKSPDVTTDGGVEAPDAATDGNIEVPNVTTDGALEVKEEEMEEAVTESALDVVLTSVNFKLSTELSDDEKYVPVEEGNGVEFELVLSGAAEYTILLEPDINTAVELPDGEYSVKAGTFAPYGYKVDDGMSVREFYVSDGVAYNSDGAPLTDTMDVYYTRSGKVLFAIELVCEFTIAKGDGERSIPDEDALFDPDTGLTEEDKSLSGGAIDGNGTPNGSLPGEDSENGSGSDNSEESSGNTPDDLSGTDSNADSSSESGDPINTDDSSSPSITENKEAAGASGEKNSPNKDSQGENGSATEAVAPSAAGSGIIPMDALYKDLINNDLIIR
jgi:hypothetical protein